MRDHGSIGLFLGNGIFCGNFGFEFFGLFLFCFCLVRGEKVIGAQDFGWQSKGEDERKERITLSSEGNTQRPKNPSKEPIPNGSPIYS